MNGYNFTERVRKILALAREHALRLQHDHVRTEHILLGLLEEGEGVGAAVLQNLGIDLEQLAVRVNAAIKPGGSGFARFLRGAPSSVPTGPDLPYSARAKKVLELSMVEARDLSHSYVGTEHLLLALFRERKGLAAQVLAEAGANVDVVRQATLKLLGTELPRASSTELTAPSSARSSRIENITIEVQLTDGSNMRGEFRDSEEAFQFLWKAVGRS